MIRLFGVTDTANSVMCTVTGFYPYFYVAAPAGFRTNDVFALRDRLNAFSGGDTVIKVEVKMKENLYGFRGNQKSPFIRITCADQKRMVRVRGHFERGEFSFDNFFTGPQMTFESNIAYELRFMIDSGVLGMNWIELPPGKYRHITQNKLSNCQIEVSIHWTDLISHPAEGQWLKMAPLRILSFDIECAGRRGVFPEAQVDPVIQIANVVTAYGESKPFIRNVFTIDTCSPIVGTQIMEHTDQRKMLEHWAEFVREVDPDVIIGYNVANFDVPYLLDRANHLKSSAFPYLGRIRNQRTEIKETTFSSKAYGTRESKTANMDGRIQFDMLQVMQRDYKLRSYTLNSVCAQFLGEQKEDVPHSIITDLQNGTPESRRRLAVYCLKDAFLPQRLMDKLMCLVNYTEMARVTGVPFNYLLSRGQQIKVISQLFRKALANDLVVPNIRSESGDEQYEGATVIEPIKGYYDSPIATLDFTSLYPSIMQAHNLCYTTLLSPEVIEAQRLKKDEDYIVTPNGGMVHSTISLANCGQIAL